MHRHFFRTKEFKPREKQGNALKHKKKEERRKHNDGKEIKPKKTRKNAS